MKYVATIKYQNAVVFGKTSITRYYVKLENAQAFVARELAKTEALGITAISHIGRGMRITL